MTLNGHNSLKNRGEFNIRRDNVALLRNYGFV